VPEQKRRLAWSETERATSRGAIGCDMEVIVVFRHVLLGTLACRWSRMGNQSTIRSRARAIAIRYVVACRRDLSVFARVRTSCNLGALGILVLLLRIAEGFSTGLEDGEIHMLKHAVALVQCSHELVGIGNVLLEDFANRLVGSLGHSLFQFESDTSRLGRVLGDGTVGLEMLLIGLAAEVLGYEVVEIDLFAIRL
jgi:hypothetical protein